MLNSPATAAETIQSNLKAWEDIIPKLKVLHYFKLKSATVFQT